MISSSRLVNCSRSASSAPQSAASVRPQPLSVVPQLLVRRRGAARAIPDVAQAEAVCTTANAIADISLIDAATAGALQSFLRPITGLYSVLFIARIVMTWYPDVDGRQAPWVIAYAPTEFILRPTRAIVPPLAGVDISPIVWFGILSFMNEILLGPQGLLAIIQREGGL